MSDLMQIRAEDVEYVDLVLKACEGLAMEAYKVPSEGIRRARAILAAALADHERIRGAGDSEDGPWEITNDITPQLAAEPIRGRAGAEGEVQVSAPVCGHIGRTRFGGITVTCTRPAGHQGSHGGMGCEWRGEVSG